MKLTQRDKIIRHLQDYGSITSWQAYAEYGITQLGARIWELKRMGYEFDTEFETATNRYGEIVSFKVYRLKAKMAN